MEHFNTYEAWINALRENSNSEYPIDRYTDDLPAIACVHLA